MQRHNINQQAREEKNPLKRETMPCLKQEFNIEQV
jgi:hypothetical protein